MYWGSEDMDPRILNLGARWRWVFSFTPRPFHPRGKNRQYPLDRRLDGPQSRSEQRKMPSPCQESNLDISFLCYYNIIYASDTESTSQSPSLQLKKKST